MEMEKLINENLIFLDLDGKDKYEVLKKIVYKINDRLLSKEDFLKDLIIREKTMSTGLSNYIAIPHSQSDYVAKDFVAVAKLKTEVEWETLDNSLVKAIILIGINKNKKQNNHLKILADLAKKLMEENTIQRLVETNNKEEIIKIMEG